MGLQKVGPNLATTPSPHALNLKDIHKFAFSKKKKFLSPLNIEDPTLLKGSPMTTFWGYVMLGSQMRHVGRE